MKRPAVLLTGVLFVLSFVLIGYRILWLNYPLFPPLPEEAWQLSMEADVKAEQGEVEVMIGFPASRSGQIVAEERITSGELNFNLLREDSNQIGVWSGSVGGERELVGYRATLLKNPEKPSRTGSPSVEPLPVIPYSGGTDSDEEAVAELGQTFSRGQTPGSDRNGKRPLEISFPGSGGPQCVVRDEGKARFSPCPRGSSPGIRSAGPDCRRTPAVGRSDHDPSDPGAGMDRGSVGERCSRKRRDLPSFRFFSPAHHGGVVGRPCVPWRSPRDPLDCDKTDYQPVADAY